MAEFAAYMRNIASRSDQQIEPQVQKLSDDKKAELREMQDLKHGAVRSATIQEGSGRQPGSGDVAVFDYEVLPAGSTAAVVTAAVERLLAGNGTTHVAAIGKGMRTPRAWELILQDMQVGQVCTVTAEAGYGFVTGDSKMPVPSGCKSNGSLTALLFLRAVLSSKQAKPLLSQPDVIKVTHARGDGWQTARPPYQISFRCALGLIQPDMALPGTGSNAWKACTAVLGQRALPEAVEAAVQSMPEGEMATFVMQCASVRATTVEGAVLPTMPASGQALCLLYVQMQAFVEVRDMTGDGKLLKRTLRRGQGEFPIDAPVHDATLRIHYAITRPVDPSELLYTTLPHDSHDSSKQKQDSGADAAREAAVPLAGAYEFTTGDGLMPLGVEMALKLMLPGEQAHLTLHPDYGVTTCVAGVLDNLPRAEPLDVWLQLCSFDKDSHPEAMNGDEMIAHATKLKEHANKLYAGKHLDFAIKKYDRGVALIKRHRAVDTEEQAAALAALQGTLLTNLAAAHMAKQEYTQAVKCCDAAHQLDPSNLKAVLRRGKASSLNGDFEEAEGAATLALEHCGDDDAALRGEAEELVRVNRKRRAAAHARQRYEFTNFFER